MFEKYIIDRIEGEFAVCEVFSECPENREIIMKNIPLSDLPAEIREGSHLIIQGGIYTLAESSEQETRDRIEEKLKKLFNR